MQMMPKMSCVQRCGAGAPPVRIEVNVVMLACPFWGGTILRGAFVAGRRIVKWKRLTGHISIKSNIHQ
jgi:hypothetical protein